MKYPETKIEYEVTWLIISSEDKHEEGNRYTRRSGKANDIAGIQKIIQQSFNEPGLYSHSHDFKIIKRIISEMEISDEEKKAIGL